MNCRFCATLLAENSVEGGYCSQLCRAKAEHEERLRNREHMSIHICDLDDGGVSVEIKERVEGEFTEMTKTFENLSAALRGIADLCTASADSMDQN